jgi:hypothetical protein
MSRHEDDHPPITGMALTCTQCTVLMCVPEESLQPHGMIAVVPNVTR